MRLRLSILAAVATVIAGVALASTANAATLFADDFEDGNASGWSKSGGDWSVVSDGSQVLQQSKPDSELARQFAGSSGWTSYTVQARVKPTGFDGSGTYAGIAARAAGSTKMYRLVLINTNRAELQYHNGSSVTVIGGANLTVSTGTWYSLQITLSGSSISGFVNGIQVGSGSDNAIGSGRIALLTFHATARFDDVLVTDSAVPPSPSPSQTNSPPPATTVRYEAENGECDGTIDSDWPGYSGSGFCNTDNAFGAGVTFTVAGSGSAATVAVRYANGGSANRPANVIVNGSTQLSNVAFNPTGTWDSWATVTATVNLAPGNNSLRLQATGADGLPNVDYIDVTGGGTISPSPSISPSVSPSTSPTPSTSPPPPGDTLYVSPNGSDSASGTISDPTTLGSAITRIAAGGTIYMRGGTYRFSQTVTIQPNNSGTSSARKKLFAYPGETPILNFSAQSEDPANRGLAIGGSFWHIHGIVVERAGDNGILLAGNNNIIERVVTRFNRDSGLQLSRLIAGAPREQWPSHNLIISTESHDNADSDGEDADGFAPKLTVGPGNVFRYTVSHNNIDDGYDLYTKSDTGPIGVVTIEDSLAYDNGTLSDGSQAGAGDRNGYKLGGEDIAVDHIIRRNFAYRNGKHGFTYNRNLGTMTVSNNVSIDNASGNRNFTFDGGTSVFRNNTSCRFNVTGSNDRIVGDVDGSNQFWSGTNGSRCSTYTGTLGWYFASDGRLVVTLGGRVVTP